MPTLDDIQDELEKSVQRTTERFEDKQKGVTGIPKPFNIEVSETVFEPGKFKTDVQTGTKADSDLDGRGPDPVDEFPPGDDDDDGLGVCHCEDTLGWPGAIDESALNTDSYRAGYLVQPRGCDAETLRRYCLRTVKYHYYSDGVDRSIDSRVVYSGTSIGVFDPCSPEDDLDETTWFFNPDGDTILDWLANMDEPPILTPVGTPYDYTLILYFECFRLGTASPSEAPTSPKFIPCGDEESSEILLTGVCYRRNS